MSDLSRRHKIGPLVDEVRRMLRFEKLPEFAYTDGEIRSALIDVVQEQLGKPFALPGAVEASLRTVCAELPDRDLAKVHDELVRGLLADVRRQVTVETILTAAAQLIDRATPKTRREPVAP